MDDNLEADEVTGDGRSLTRGEFNALCDSAAENEVNSDDGGEGGVRGEVARSRTASSLSLLETLRFKTLARALI